MFTFLFLYNLSFLILILSHNKFPTSDSWHYAQKLHFVWLIVVGILFSFFSVSFSCTLVGWSSNEVKYRMIFHHMAFFSLMFWLGVLFFVMYMDASPV
jgi:hypothetical protein